MSSLLLLLLSVTALSLTFAQSPMKAFLPTSVHEWKASEDARVYSGDEIFGYMNGAGEIYRSYAFRTLLTQRYARPNEAEILAEIFDMGSPRNAYGVFTYMQGRGPAVDIGQDGEYKNGLLCFWRGRYFACIMTDKDSDLAKEAILGMGKFVSDAIGEDGDKPAILHYLPEGEYIQTTLRYFRSNDILNIHYYVGEDNLLRINEETEGILVRLKADKSYLLLIAYPGRERADSAYRSFVAGYMPDAQEEGVYEKKKGKWTACGAHNEFVAVVFDSQTKEHAKNALGAVIGRLP